MPDNPVLNSVPTLNSSSPSTPTTVSSTTIASDDLFETLASYSGFELIQSQTFNDGMRRKISCFFIDKATMKKEDIFHCRYGKEVKSLIIDQKVTKFGIDASVEIEDISGSLTSVLNGQSNFYFVVTIFELLGEDDGSNNPDSKPKEINCKQEEGLVYQPYVFEIESMEPISPDGNPITIYRIQLLDIVSATLKKVSYGNLLLRHPEFPNSSNFVELLQTLLDFAGEIINFNHNKSFSINTQITLVDDVADSINDIIKGIVLYEIPIVTTCYDLLNHIHKYTAREVQPPSNFKGDIPGNVLLPIILQDEFPDLSAHYKQYFNRQENNSSLKTLAFTSSILNVTSKLIKREFTAKCILMPFEMAFTNKIEKCLIYENINPLQDAKGKLQQIEEYFTPSNGLVISPISENIDIMPPNSLIGFGWKNLSLLSETPSGGANLLVYFNWIYEFYKAAFLNEGQSYIGSKLGKQIQPSIDPHFHKMETANLTGGDGETFAKINSNTIMLKTSDTTKEALFYVGRTLKSFIFLNAMFSFKINGASLRHPGEIIKITTELSDKDNESSTGGIGNVEALKNNFVLAYTTAITHIFNNNSYSNMIHANKICSIS